MTDDDFIRDAIVARAESLGHSAYAIGRATGIDPGSVKRYFTGRFSLNSQRISAICRFLNLDLRPVD